MMIRALILVMLLSLVVSPLTTAQEMVVSETKNDNSQDAEWTELLVIKDNADLRGYIVTDNRGEGDQRQSGPQFKNIDAWAHMRAGTIIVVHHGPKSTVQNEDLDAADGYLELSQFDLNYFDIVNVDGAAASNGMNLNVDRDFVQVLKPDTTHCHGIGYGKPPGPIYSATPAPKANFDTLNIGASRSVCVTGQTLAAYAAGVGKDSLSQGLNTSLGLPNKIDIRKIQQGLVDVNYRYWQELREPEWTSTPPTITLLNQTARQHVIQWTSVEDPFVGDGLTGVLVLRDTLDFAQFPTDVIVDGKIITQGQRIGTATVIAVLPTAAGNTYTDSVNLVCGVSYTYRVYAYRFDADDQLGQPDPVTARGRQYSQAFAQSSRITKADPPKPEIFASRPDVCPGDTFTIHTTTLDADFYEWTVNGRSVPTGGTTSIIVSETGTYQLKITAPGGCSALSNEVTVRERPAPEVLISPTGLQSICSGESVTLTSLTTASTYEWLKDGQVIQGASGKSYVATAPGQYRVRIASSEGCAGTSSIVTIAVKDVRFHFEPTSLDFGTLGECETSKSLTVDLVNDGAEAIAFNQVVMSDGFALSFPATGFAVEPGGRQTVRILFAPADLGVTTGTASFTATPCAATQTIDVRGEKSKASVILDRVGIDYGIYLSCPTSDVRADSGFFVINNGDVKVTFTPPLVKPPFYLLTQFTKVDLEPKEGFEIRIQYRPLGPQLDMAVTDVIAFPYTSVTCSDTLRANLKAASFFPKLELVEDDIDLGLVLSCVGTADTVLVVRNVAPVPAVVTGNSHPNVTITGAPFTLEPGEVATIPITVTPPAGPASFTIKDSLTTALCGLHLPFTLSGTIFAPAITAVPDELDLDPVSLCDTDPTSSASYTIRVSGSLGLRLPVASVRANAPFSVDVVPGVNITDSLKVNVTFTPQNPGTFTDTVLVVFGPCNDTVRCVVRAAALSTGRSTRIESRDFGTLAIGETSERTVVIKNVGTDLLDVEPLDGVASPWNVLSETPTLPAAIAPSDSAVIVLRYSYAGQGRMDTIVIRSRTVGLCADTVSFTLTGATEKGVDTTITGITLVIPADVTARVGETAEFPVALLAPAPLTGQRLRTFRAYLSYDPTIFKAVNVSYAAQGIAADIAETLPGKAVLTVQHGADIEASDTLVRISGATYLGASRVTPLEIDSVVAAGFEISGRDGELTLVGDCAVETQVIEFGKPPALEVVSATPHALVVRITTLTDDPVDLILADMSGHRLRPISIRVRPGIHDVRLDVYGAAAGAYVVQMQHGRYVGSTKFILTH